MDYNNILKNLSSFTENELIDFRVKCNKEYLASLSQMMQLTDEMQEELDKMSDFMDKVSDEIISRG